MVSDGTPGLTALTLPAYLSDPRGVYLFHAALLERIERMTDEYNYPAKVEPDEDGRFVVTFPDFGDFVKFTVILTGASTCIPGC